MKDLDKVNFEVEPSMLETSLSLSIGDPFPFLYISPLFARGMIVTVSRRTFNLVPASMDCPESF